MILLFLACATPSDDSAGDDSADALPTLALVDENNAEVALELTVAVFDLEARQDVGIEWSQLTMSEDGTSTREVPVTSILVDVFPSLDIAAVTDALERGELRQVDASFSMLLDVSPQQTGIMLSQMQNAGIPLDPTLYFTAEQGTWLVRLTDQARRPLAYAFLRPTTASARQVAIGDATSRVHVGATLDTTEVPEVPDAQVLLDWSALGADARGGALDTDALELARIEHFEQGLTELGAVFEERADLASAAWSAQVKGQSSVATSALLDAAGQPFSGFTPGGSWVLTLSCSGCGELAPPVVVPLDVR